MRFFVSLFCLLLVAAQYGAVQAQNRDALLKGLKYSQVCENDTICITILRERVSRVTVEVCVKRAIGICSRRIVQIKRINSDGWETITRDGILENREDWESLPRKDGFSLYIAVTSGFDDYVNVNISSHNCPIDAVDGFGSTSRFYRAK